ncbi:MAG: lipid-A-disaccharide synthase N-terminal domain-containing protein [Candidatus Woesearchaeota archaeon]|nr:lipid-A-disaccharide synthase N-terminal domain-containing protein [Candidatus Woesearchaeota archaeon]
MTDTIVGWIGGALFFLSWIVQNYQTKMNKQVTFSNSFFWMRVVGSLLLTYEAIILQSLVFTAVNFLTALMQFYNIWVNMKSGKIKH